MHRYFNLLDDNEESSPGTMLVESNVRELPLKINLQNDMEDQVDLLNEIIERTIIFAQTKGIDFDIHTSHRPMLNRYIIGDIINQIDLMKYDFPSIL